MKVGQLQSLQLDSNILEGQMNDPKGNGGWGHRSSGSEAARPLTLAGPVALLMMVALFELWSHWVKRPNRARWRSGGFPRSRTRRLPDNSYMDLTTGWRLHILIPIVKSGMYGIQLHVLRGLTTVDLFRSGFARLPVCADRIDEN
jgi:hypothetical protein